MSPSALCSLCPAVVALSALDPRGRCPSCAPCAICALCHEVYQPCDGPCPCHRDGLDPEPCDLDPVELDARAHELDATRAELDTPIADLLLAPELVPWPEGSALPWELGWTPAGIDHAEAA